MKKAFAGAAVLSPVYVCANQRQGRHLGRGGHHFGVKELGSFRIGGRQFTL